MSVPTKCPHCGYEFLADLRHGSTMRSLQPVDAPIRDDVPVCMRCGLIERFHLGSDNLAAARGCEGFVEPRSGADD